MSQQRLNPKSSPAIYITEFTLRSSYSRHQLDALVGYGICE
jgi:hypothetical protein